MEPARAAQPEFKPHVFGKFYLLQRLAVGGMAEIYRAKIVGAAGFEKELAVKRVLAARAQNPGFIQMLVNEAKLTAQLTHSNITQIYECDAVDGTAFIAMELVHGVSMKEMMAAFTRAGVTLTPEQAIFVVLQLLQGLDYAHRKTGGDGEPLRIVHCDVSPDNALVSWEGEVKLLDFGIARASAGLSNYKEGMLMGKLGYVAPEQASAEKAWDHRVDLFAAGIILYELLTRQKPFPKAVDVESLIASRKAKVTPPSATNERIPKELDAILERALSWDPERRFPSARHFADALVDVLFPTPHSSLQDLLGRQMREVFAERIGRQRAARAHDALVMKVLRAAPDPVGGNGAQPLRTLPELDILSSTLPKPPPRAARRPAPVPRRSGPPVWALALGAVGLVAAAAALTLGVELYVRPGVLVVTSDPPGAEVSVNGATLAGVTPTVVPNVPLARPVSVTVTAKDRRPFTTSLDPQLGTLVRRVHAPLRSSVGALTIDSDPRGAAVSLDGKPAGQTPTEIGGVHLDEPHRIDLVLPGRELDQFVVQPDRDGQKFLRKLVPARPVPTTAAAPLKAPVPMP